MNNVFFTKMSISLLLIMTISPMCLYAANGSAFSSVGTNAGVGKAIDLGLSVEWASCNIGATTPEEYGNSYARGETETKSDFTYDKYIYYNPSTSRYTDIGNSISGTKYDVAHVKWGGSWRMPTREEFVELCSKCTCTWVMYNGVYRFIGLSVCPVTP
jgi:hypothetical protein